MKLSDMIKLGAKGFKPADIKELEGSGVQTDDVIKLAENGYSVADVKELITIAGTDEQLQPGNDSKKEDSGPDPKDGDDGDKDKLDYKKEYEAKQTEAEDLKKKLAELQLENSRKNLGDGKTEDPREKVQEIFRQIY